MPTSSYVTLKELSEAIGLERSNTRKWLLSQGFTFVQVRDESSRQRVNALTAEDAERAIELRLGQGYVLQRNSGSSQVIQDGTGFFYVIRLMPDLAPNRIKIGFATSLQPRIDAHRCTCPRLELVKTWACRKTFEPAAIAIAANGSAVLYGGEVYDVASVDDVIGRLDAFFAMLTVQE